jgi:hypothetical protein
MMTKNKTTKFRKLLPLYVGLVLLSLSCRSFGLIPLESLLLGSFENQYIADVSDPLQYIFKDFERLSTAKGAGELYSRPGMSKLGIYRGFFEEGQNLNNTCRSPGRLSYATTSEKIEAKRTYLSTLQYVGLDVITNFLPLYAKFFEFNSSEYENLVTGLIGNSCSQNITVVSLRSLKKNMMAKFNTESSLKLPSIQDHPRFSKSLHNLEKSREGQERAFAMTIDLFKSFCSWGNNTDNYRLLVPLLRSPVIAAMVVRELSGYGLAYDSYDNRVLRRVGVDTRRIACDNLICRKVNPTVFLQKFPRSIGSTGIDKDLERLYCSEFRDADYQIKYQVPQLSKKIKEITFDEQNHLVGQFISMMTGVPDFILLSPKYTSLAKTMRSSVDEVWDTWANSQNELFKKALTYEEALTIEVVPQKFYFNRYRPKFSVELDVNLGEFDRVNTRIGKLKTSIKLNFTKKFLKWARDSWRVIDPSVDKKKVARIELPFEKMIEDQFKDQVEKFPTLPLKREVIGVITREIVGHLITYDGEFFDKDIKGSVEIPVHFNFAPFALRHLRYRYEIQRNEGKVIGELQKLRALRL